MESPKLSRLQGTLLRAGLLVLGVAVLGACSDTAQPVTAPDEMAVFSNGGELGELSVQARMDLATLRRVVAPFHNFDLATAAGWDTPLTPCLESPDGGMGYHYANLPLLDGEVAADEPEALLFEPQKNGKLRFVGVEYIVPLELSEEAPTLFGHEFHRNEAVGIWALHAWVGRHNPSGTFADWNPLVSCDHAEE